MIEEEVQKCKDSAYYFATNYIKIKISDKDIIPFSTNLSKEEFDNLFNDLKNGRLFYSRLRR